MAAGVAVYLVADAVVDRSFVERRLSRGLAGAFPSVSATAGEVRVLPLRFGVAVDSLRLAVRDGVPSDPSPGAAAGPAWVLSAPRATLTGVGIAALLRGELAARELRLVAPRLHRLEGPVPDRGRPDRARRDAPSSADVRLDRVRVVGATVDLSAVLPSAPLAGVANGADLELRDLSVGGGTAAPPALLGALSRLRVASYRARETNGGASLRMAGFELDLAAREARVDGVRYRSIGPAAPGVDRGGRGRVAEDTVEVALDRPRANGVTVDTGSAPPSLGARTLTVDSVRVRVVDGVVPGTSPERGPPRTPVQRLRSLGFLTGRVDSLHVREGRVRYLERRRRRPEPGTVLFDRIEARSRPFLFGPAPAVPRRDTVRFSLSGRVAEAAPFWLTVRVPDRPEGFTFDVDGRLTSLDLPALNTMFRPTEGIHLQSGRLDSLRFRLRTRNGRAAGRVIPVYDGLDLTLEDPRTGGRGLDERVKSFLAGLRLNARNDPADGDDFRAGEIEHSASPGETFPAFLWKALLSGLRDVAGV